MALTQFNQWEPTLDPVNGVMAQEPRLFAHDAVAVVVGAINNSDSNHGLEVTNYGTGYAVGDTITLSTPAAGVVGDRAVVTVLAIATGGVVSDYSVTTVGAKYVLNEVVTQAATSGTGVNFAAKVSNIDIPNTQKRGACLYIGAAAGLATLSVVMESGNTAVFNTISGGTVLPILVKRITTGGLAANDVIALF
jgi:hypothetical protein